MIQRKRWRLPKPKVMGSNLTVGKNFSFVICCGASKKERHLGITLSVVRLSHFWFAYNFFTLRDTALIFGMCVPCDKTYGTINIEHVTLTVTFDLHFENFHSTHNFFLPVDIGLSYWASVFFMTRPFRWYYKFWSRDLDRYLWSTLGKIKL